MMKADLSFVHRLFVCVEFCVWSADFCVRIFGADFWCGFFGADFSVRIFRCGFFGADFSVRIFRCGFLCGWLCRIWISPEIRIWPTATAGTALWKFQSSPAKNPSERSSLRRFHHTSVRVRGTFKVPRQKPPQTSKKTFASKVFFSRFKVRGAVCTPWCPCGGCQCQQSKYSWRIVCATVLRWCWLMKMLAVIICLRSYWICTKIVVSKQDLHQGRTWCALQARTLAYRNPLVQTCLSVWQPSTLQNQKKTLGNAQAKFFSTNVLVVLLR